MSIWKQIERSFKKHVMNRDVPALEGELPTELIDLVIAGKKMALSLIDDLVDDAWNALVEYDKELMTREQFDAAVKAVKNVIGEVL